MSKMKTIINEEVIKYVNELFDASHEPYKWKRDIDGGNYYYYFVTDDNDEYYVDIVREKYEGEESWEISFRVEGYKYHGVVNKGDIFKVMSTIIVDIWKNDFIREKNPKLMTFIPSKNNPDDERRLKLYLGYIDKHLSDMYDVEIDRDLDPPEVIMRRK